MTEPRDIEKDKAMCEAATIGPWREYEKEHVKSPFGTYRSIDSKTRNYETDGRLVGFDLDGYISPADAIFIAESRTALPYYITEYEAALAQIKRLEAVVMAIRDYDNILDPSAAGLIAWVESVTFYEDIVEQMQEGDE